MGAVPAVRLEALATVRGVARVGRVGVTAVAVVGGRDIGDEVVARPRTCRRDRVARLAGVDHSDHRTALALGLQFPGAAASRSWRSAIDPCRADRSVRSRPTPGRSSATAKVRAPVRQSSAAAHPDPDRRGAGRCSWAGRIPPPGCFDAAAMARVSSWVGTALAVRCRRSGRDAPGRGRRRSVRRRPNRWCRVRRHRGAA